MKDFIFSGDVLMRDNYGYFYFLDRIGDTFRYVNIYLIYGRHKQDSYLGKKNLLNYCFCNNRWKGENISSTEIENVLATVAQCEICVFGVEVRKIFLCAHIFMY